MLLAEHADGNFKAMTKFKNCVRLTSHRIAPPFGLAGGESGQVGENSVRRKDGGIEKLKGCDATDIDADEAIIIQTRPRRRGIREGGMIRRSARLIMTLE